MRSAKKIEMNEWQRDNERIIAHFSDLLQQHGKDVRSLDWDSWQTQELRFEVLAGIGLKSGQSVLDVGCGLAHMKEYFQRKGLNLAYTGYDLVPGMVEQARARILHLNAEVRDILKGPEPEPSFDWVLSSGIFSLRQHESMQFMDHIVRRMFALCRLGVAFNTLSTYADRRYENEFYADPVEVLRLCLSISPRVVIRHDYMPHDFTVYLYREIKGL